MKKSGEFLKKLSKNGFYIILFLCITAIGVAGYVMFQRDSRPGDADLMNDWDLPASTDSNYDFESVIKPQPIEIPDTPKVTAPAPKSKTKPAQKKNNTVKKVTPASKNITITTEPTRFVAAVKGKVNVSFSGDNLVKSKTFGDWRTHNGVDIAASEGTKVCVIADGIVKQVYEDEMMGHTVVVEHNDKMTSTYSNLMKGIVVKVGQKIKAGDVIGGVGTSAIAECMESPHLHLEVMKNGECIDPMSVLPKQ